MQQLHFLKNVLSGGSEPPPHGPLTPSPPPPRILGAPTLLRPFVTGSLHCLALPPPHRGSQPAYSQHPKFPTVFFQLSRVQLPPSPKLRPEPILPKRPASHHCNPRLRLPRAYPTRARACRALLPGSPSPRPAAWRWPRRAAPSPGTRCSAAARRGLRGRSGSAAAEGRSRPRSSSRSRPRSAAQAQSRSRSRPPPGSGPPAAAAAPGAGSPAPVRGGQRPWPNPPTQQKPRRPRPLPEPPATHATLGAADVAQATCAPRKSGAGPPRTLRAPRALGAQLRKLWTPGPMLGG